MWLNSQKILKKRPLQSLRSLKGVVIPALHRYSTQTSESKCPISSTSSPKIKSPDPHVRKMTFNEEEYQRAKPFSTIPGPSGFKMINNVVFPWGRYYKKDMMGLFTELQKEYGNLVRLPPLFGRDPIYFLCDPNEAEVIFRNEGPTPFRKNMALFEIFRKKERPDVFGETAGLIQDQGKSWQTTRTKVNPIMMQPKTVKLYIGAVDSITSEFIERIYAIRDAKTKEMPADFQNELNKWALESISYIALNQRLDLLGNTDKDSRGQQLIENVQVFLNLSFRMEFLPSLWKYYETPNYKKVMKSLHIVTDIITYYIEKAIEEMEKNRSTSGSAEGVLHKLLKIDKNIAIVTALDMMMAGVDTTANTTAFLLYALANNPDKQAILRKEIMEILPQKNSILTEESMKNMPYLRACMKEASRLRPTVVGTARRLPVDTVIAGYQFKKFTDIAMASHFTSTSEQFFKRPNEFIPERYLKSKPCPELQTQHPFAFLPFGYGPRMCVGRRFAELEMEILTAKLIRNFDIQWHHPELKVKTEMLSSYAGPLKFTLIDI